MEAKEGIKRERNVRGVNFVLQVSGNMLQTLIDGSLYTEEEIGCEQSDWIYDAIIDDYVDEYFEEQRAREECPLEEGWCYFE